MRAQCQCGQLRAELPADRPIVVACHCQACQRRTGSPFGMLAYYRAEQVTITGNATSFQRPADSGGTLESSFCPACGTSLYARASKLPDLIGIAVGAIDDAAFPAPQISVWEQTKRPWTHVEASYGHFDRDAS